MREDVELIGEVDDMEAFEKAERGDSSVEIEARRKPAPRARLMAWRGFIRS